jgi:hypothetical protein
MPPPAPRLIGTYTPPAVRKGDRCWKAGEWNERRARIEGNPPKLTTWIKGVRFLESTDTERRLPDKGGIVLQVHDGGDLTTQFVR